MLKYKVHSVSSNSHISPVLEGNNMPNWLRSEVVKERKVQNYENEPYLLHATISFFKDNKGVLAPIEELAGVELNKQYDFEVEVEIEDEYNRKSILQKLELCVSSEHIEVKTPLFKKLLFDDNSIAKPKVSIIPRSAENDEIILNFGFLQDFRLVYSIPVPFRIIPK